MLADSKAVAFVTVTDLDRARAFYEGVLSLKVLSQDVFAVMAQAGGVKLRISRAPVVVPAPYTVAGFDVEDIDAIVDGLASRGVVFERYPFFGDAQDARGVWSAPGGARVAWFKDPDGNLLSVQRMG
ncbi:MAG: glyoxalase/bleomycin resistance protein/dioxygenase [Caulobacteraceae bacterium]|nr:glyoxalase/bleomycin resistance protein/dioxygenase [Caulobacteraceae bacterium]